MKSAARNMHKRGLHEEAEQAYRQALVKAPRDGEIHWLLGLLFHETDRHAEAVESLERARRLDPDRIEALSVLALSLAAVGRDTDALITAQEYLTHEHSDSAMWRLLVEIHYSRAEWEAALAACQTLARMSGENVEILHRLAKLAYLNDATDQAETYFEQALSIAPNHGRLNHDYAVMLHGLKAYKRACKALTRAVSIDPNNILAWNLLITTRQLICDWQALNDEQPGFVSTLERHVASNSPVLFSPDSLNYLDVDPDLYNRLAAHYARQVAVRAHESTPALKQLRQGRHPRIRIGYVSPDFGARAVGHLVQHMFEHHDRERFECFGYSLQNHSDPVAAAIARSFDQYRDFDDASLSQIVHRIVEDEIDILVDLGGYGPDSKPDIFSLRPAPVQVSYLGYLNSLWADCYDHIVADRVLIPEDQEANYRVSVLRLPGSFMVCSPVQVEAEPPDRETLGLPAEGFVFCCHSSTYKIESRVFASWMKILNRVPDSVLWLYAGGDVETERILRRYAQRESIDPARLIFAERVALEAHQSRMRQADLFLDTFLYNTGASAAGSLLAGVPLLTLKGSTMRSRVGASMLEAIGLKELIADTQEEYETLAVALASEPYRLMDMREHLDAARKTDGFFDVAAFTAKWERALMQAWNRFASAAAGHAPHAATGPRDAPAGRG